MAHKKGSLQKDKSKYTPQRDKIEKQINISELDWTENQKIAIEVILASSNKIIFLEGPSGTSKTLLAIYCGLKLLNRKNISDILYVRSAVESSDSSLGYLPGDLAEKFEGYVTPLNDKLEELLKKEDIEYLHKDNRVNVCPVNFARGLSWNARYIVLDESQNFSRAELTTLMTRMGEHSKMIICGDPSQSDLHNSHRNDFMEVLDLFRDQESLDAGIRTIKFEEEDIMRSELCKFIVKKFNKDKKDRRDKEGK